jgi:hypothetical protein
MRFLAPAEPRETERPEAAQPAPEDKKEEDASSGGAEVVSIDAFRKK